MSLGTLSTLLQSCVAVLVTILNMYLYNKSGTTTTPVPMKTENTVCREWDKVTSKTKKKTYLILWFVPPMYIRRRLDPFAVDFSKCEYSNCKLTKRFRHAKISDAILSHRTQGKTISLKRPKGQIWIFVEHESPNFMYRIFLKHRNHSKLWENSRDKFNWTMTYNKAVADIHLPYGEFRKHKTYIARDYAGIAANKTKGALIVTSHCDTDSKRLEYISRLKEHVEVDVMGKCGVEWDCGKKNVHDDCFEFLNTSYSYYLAFENALCEQYHTEKLFENFKYDILFVTRGGIPHESNAVLPKQSVIDSRDFKDAEHLGIFLKKLQNDKNMYAEYLAKKSQYHSIDFAESYQRAMCDLCKRLNHQDLYRKTIPNLLEELSYLKTCVKGT
ncbi:hypothetical protein ACF0H5_008781 [Mactra antiquata]